MPSMHAWYGCKPDTPDPRDHLYLPRLEGVNVATLPKRASLRDKAGKPYNQLELGSCTAQSIGKVMEMLCRIMGIEVLMPSRLFIYYNEREMEGTIGDDAGAEIRDGIKSVATKGVCPESEWDYDISQFRTRPSSKAYSEALQHRAINYKRVQIFSQRQAELTWTQMKACIAAGYPFVYGFNVPESFEGPETEKSGIVTMPERGEQFVGGHAGAAIGYDETMTANGVTGYLETINSWNDDWGDEGFFWLPKPFAIAPALVSDAWTIRSET